ncbi:putative odorant-binding protein A5 [Planococcus citri]|uniref:putative odorant-binding protein A5 n=1 Tax=Planococcus citri TaxID=170843 RepID=UPI0031F7507C
MYLKSTCIYFALVANLIICIRAEENVAQKVRHVTKKEKSQEKAQPKVFKKMVDMGIVPHVIPKLPTTILHVTYPLVFLKFRVQEGDGETFHEYATKKQPSVEWECSPLLYYTFFMTHINVTNYTKPFDNFEYYDPRPGRLIGAKQYHNWLYYNIPGCDFYKGEELFHYIAPKPMENNEHRIYLLLMFKQKRKFSITLEERKRFRLFPDWKFHNSHRWEFPIEEFMDKYDLGELIAGNFFRQQGDGQPKLF